MIKSNLFKLGVGSVAIKVLGAVFSLVVSIILARGMGSEDFGSYSLALSLILVVGMLCQLGFPQLIVRETAKYNDLKLWGHMRELWRWSGLVVISCIGIVAIFTIGFLYFWREEPLSTVETTFLIGMIFLPFYILNLMKGAALQGLGAPIAGQLGERIMRPASFTILLFFILFIWQEIPLTPLSAMFLNALAAGVAFTLSSRLHKKIRPYETVAASEDASERQLWIASVFPLGLITGFGLINQQADILILGYFRSASEVGVYRVVLSVSALVAFGLQSINIVIGPHFARLYAKNDLEKLQLLVSKSTLILTLAAIPLLPIFLLYGEDILGVVFGQEYVSGKGALIVLSIGQLANVSMGAVGLLLNMTGHEKHTLYGLAISATLNILLNLILIPLYGIMGAALATMLSMVMWNVLLCISVKRRIGINSSIFRRW